MSVFLPLASPLLYWKTAEDTYRQFCRLFTIKSRVPRKMFRALGSFSVSEVIIKLSNAVPIETVEGGLVLRMQRRMSVRKGLVVNYIYFACLNDIISYFYTVKEPLGLNCLAMRKSCCQSESDLLLKISKGDEDAFNKAVDIYAPMIYATALAYIKIVESAEDTTQEVFYKVWKNRAKLTEVESLKDYLFIITRNEVLSSLRKKGPSYPLGEHLDGTLKEKSLCPGDTLSLRQLQQTLQRAVTMLPPQQKQAYLLSREEGLQHNEIAQKMNLSRNTVKNHIIAALNFIRQYVQDNADVVFLLMAFLMIF